PEKMRNEEKRLEALELEISAGNLGRYGILTRVFLGIIQTLDQIKPDILIYIKDLENEAIRGVRAAISASPRVSGVTEIAIPLEELKHLTWLTDLPVEALKQWNKPKIRLEVITQDRPDSLARLIRSLKSSYYFGDDMPLTINVDRNSDPVTIEYCKTLEWNFGQKNIRHRIIQGGLMAAVVESYYPVDDNDYAVLLEDDIEVSPFFYSWTKYSVLKYRYGIDRILSRRMYGISLYSSKINELHKPGRKQFSPLLSFEGTTYSLYSPYLGQVPCSWGAVYFPEIWREFHHYFIARLEDSGGLRVQNITIPESRSNRWRNSWKRFFIELAYLRGYVMLYPNYENYTSLSTNHAEVGTHIHLGEGKPSSNEVFDVPLMKENILLQGLPDGKLPEYSDLPTMDLLGNIVTKEELVQRGRSLHYEISQCPPGEYDEITYDPQDLLCIDEAKRQEAMELEKMRNEEKRLEALELERIRNELLIQKAMELEKMNNETNQQEAMEPEVRKNETNQQEDTELEKMRNEENRKEIVEFEKLMNEANRQEDMEPEKMRNEEKRLEALELERIRNELLMQRARELEKMNNEMNQQEAMEPEVMNNEMNQQEDIELEKMRNEENRPEVMELEKQNMQKGMELEKTRPRNEENWQEDMKLEKTKNDVNWQEDIEPEKMENDANREEDIEPEEMMNVVNREGNIELERMENDVSREEELEKMNEENWQEAMELENIRK
ncbi:1342_t:CDS:2, partial [Acaulospora colombiana]